MDSSRFLRWSPLMRIVASTKTKRVRDPLLFNRGERIGCVGA